jgi:hypothetical protein
MTSLSPAAQAVLRAAGDALRAAGDSEPGIYATIAAALQAAADQVVPFSGSRKNNEIRFELLAIAAELEGQ